MSTSSRILAALVALTLLPLDGWGGSTRQVRDTLIAGNVKYAINRPPLGQLDSVHYCTLREKAGFSEFFSWNFRGYVATWRIIDGVLCLDGLKTGSEKADFREVLKDFRDGGGPIVASWFSGTIIGGTGPLLCTSGNGWDDVNETETEWTVESGKVTSSRTYTNRVQGSADRYLTLQDLPKHFNFKAFPELEGMRIPIKAAPCEFAADGKILDWTVTYLRWPDNIDPEVKERLTAAIREEFLRYDWKTCCADGRWFWHERKHFDGVIWPMWFKTGPENTKGTDE